MTSYLLAGPAAEPVTLAEAKVWLRLDDGAEDALVTTLIASARLHIEGTTGRALLAQGWRLVLDCWPEERAIRLPVSPLISLTAVTAYGDEGTGHELDLAQFETEPDRLLVPEAVEGMRGLRPRQGLEIDYVVGYGTEPADVPADLRQGLLALVAYWFEHRDVVSAAVVPGGFDRIVAPYRRVRL